MSDDCTPYIEQQPGNLITAEDWNQMQCLVQDDIKTTTQQAIDEISSVPEAGNAGKLDGKTVDELTQEIIDRAIAKIKASRGYRKLFLRLKVGEPKVIEHGFNVCPLVDAYQLDYFPVVCCEDKDVFPAWTTFYAFHCGQEKRLRYTTANKVKGSIEIQPRGGPVWGVPLKEMLHRFEVDYTEKSALSDVLNEFWKALDPDNDFDDNQICHSPWFEKCCREEMSVREARDKGHWDDLCVQWRPRKTINYPGISTAVLDSETDSGFVFGNFRADTVLTAQVAAPFPGFMQEVSRIDTGGGGATPTDGETDQPGDSTTVAARRVSGQRAGQDGDDECPSPAPTQIQVDHFNFNTLSVTLLKPPVHPGYYSANLPPGLPSIENQMDDVANELKLMLLLKC